MASLLVEAINKFGLKMHAELVQDQENIFFSPLSLSMALSMLLRGAKHETGAEMKQALHLENVKISDAEIHTHFSNLLNMYTEKEEVYTLAIANAVVCQAKFPFLTDYRSDLQTIYRALLMEVDFRENSDNAVNQINEWVKTNTKGKIPKVFDSLDSNVIMVLLNSIYFKGDWQRQFDIKRTYEESFFNNGIEEQSKSVPFMHMTKRFLFAETGTCKILQLPYRGDHMAMLMILPHEKSGIKDLERNFSTEFFKTILEDLSEVKVEVSIPKLHLEYSKGLVPILKKLGIGKLFDQKADLGGMSSVKNLYVSDVIHKSVLDVNEEGTEAAAVTGAVMMVGCCLTLNPVFKADHPFLFLIYDKRSKLILFMGHLLEF